MAPHPLVAECAALGIALEPEGPNGLAVEPVDRLTAELRARLVAAKDEVLAALRGTGTPAVLEPVVRGKLDAFVALLGQFGYSGRPIRLLARLRRDLARDIGVPSLRAIGEDAEVWARASIIVDQWIAALAADVRQGPLG